MDTAFNDLLLKGKHEMSDILQNLTRLRSGDYVLIGDVKKMFWQIMIAEEDQMYHGVIYKDETYMFTRVCFGNKPSPPIAEMSMIKVAEKGKESHPYASFALLFKRFMDDILDANNNKKVLKETKDQIDSLLGIFGFDIKKWHSNHPELGEALKSKKILGVEYSTDTDQLRVKIGKMRKKEMTKRIILSRLAEIWDPIGATYRWCKIDS